MGSNGRDQLSDLMQAVVSLTAEVAAMKASIDEMPDRVTGQVVERLFDELRSLNREDFLKMKFASVFNQVNGAHSD